MKPCTIVQVIQRIEAFASAQGWSRRRLSQEAGFPFDTSLRHLGKPQWNPTRRTIELLEAIIPPEFTGEPANNNRKGRR